MRQIAWLDGVRAFLHTKKAKQSVSRRVQKRSNNRLQQVEKLEERTLLTFPGGGGPSWGYDLSINDVDVDEGNVAQIEVNLSVPLGAPVTVDWVAHSDFVHWSHATKGADYCDDSVTYLTDPCSGTLTIPAYSTSATISVPTVQDSLYELDEFFWVELSNPSVGVTITDGIGRVKIIDDDDAGGGGGSGPFINIQQTKSVFEDVGLATLDVTLSEPSIDPVEVDYASFNGTALAGPDYTGVTGSLVFAPFETSRTITVPIVDDAIFEDSESFSVELTNPVNGQLGNKTSVINITDDDDAGTIPRLSVGDVSVEEDVGNAAITVTLDEAHATEDVTVEWRTVLGSASAPQDYVPVLDGSITIPMGETSATIYVAINDDQQEEPDEEFSIELLNPMEAIIDDGIGDVTILANDATGPPVISVSDASATEGPGAHAEVVITLSKASDQPVTVDYRTQDGTAIAPGDYHETDPAIQLTFNPGETTKSVFVGIVDDSELEPTETFSVVLSDATNATIDDGTGNVTILDNELLGVRIESGFSVIEGGHAAPVVSLTQAVEWAVVVNYATTNGSANSPADYVDASGSVTIPANTQSVPVPGIATILDTIQESTETFYVDIASNDAAVISGEGRSTVLIENVHNPSGDSPDGVPDSLAIIDPLVLKTDTGVADGITADPTVRGYVTVDDILLANTAVELDWDRDYQADGTTTTGTNGWFEYDPRSSGIAEGDVFMRARARNEDNAWSEWFTVQYVYQSHATFDLPGSSSTGLQVGVEEGIDDWSLQIPFRNPHGSNPTFSIQSGNENYGGGNVVGSSGQSLFSIDSNGVLSTTRTLDYEHQYQYNLVIRVSDSGGYDETTLRLTVHDVPLPGVAVFDAMPEVTTDSTPTLSWNEAIHADRYSIHVLSPDGSVISPSVDGTSLTLGPLTVEGQYAFRVQAHSEINEPGELSPWNTFTYDTTPNPEIPVATSPNWTSIQWDAVDHAAEYLLWYLKDGDTTPTVEENLTGTSWSPTGLAAGSYTAKVKAINSSDESWSGSPSNHANSVLDWSEPTRFRVGDGILVTDSQPWSNNADSGSSYTPILSRSGHAESGLYVDDLTGAVTLDPLPLLTGDSSTKLQQDLDGWLPTFTWGSKSAWAVASIVLPNLVDSPTVKVSANGGFSQNFYPTPDQSGQEFMVAALASGTPSTGLHNAELTVELVYPPGPWEFLNQTITIDTPVVHINREADGLGSGLSIPNHSQLIQHGNNSPLGAGHLLVRGNGTTAWYPNNGDGKAEGSVATLSTGGLHHQVLTFPDGTQHHFNSGGRLKSITDIYGRETVLNYQSGQLKTVKLPTELSGRTLTYNYTNDKLSSVTDFANREFQYQTNIGNIPLRIVGPAATTGGSRLHLDITNGDVIGNPGGFTLATGNAILKTWDVQTPQFNSHTGDVTITRPDNTYFTQSTVYQEARLNPGPISDVTSVESREYSVPGSNGYGDLLTTTSRTLDKFGFAATTTNVHGQTTVTERNDRGQVTAEWLDVPGQEPRKTRYTYTDYGALEVIDYPESIQEHWVYDSQQTFDPIKSFQAQKWVNRVGVATRYTYHDQYTGGPVGALYETKIGYGKEWTDVFDPDLALLTTTYQYDPVTKNQSTVTSTPFVGTATTTVYGYDANGYQNSVDVPGVGLNTYVYGANGLMTSHTNEINATYTYEYDDHGRQTRRTWPVIDGGEYYERITFDVQGRLKTQKKTGTGAGGFTATTTYEYDNLDRITKITHPDPDGSGPLKSAVQTWTYDTDHHTETDIHGGVTRYDYVNHDPSRVSLITYPDPEGPEVPVVEEFIYDDYGYLINTINTVGGLTTYEYNDWGWLIKESRPDSNEDLNYLYDPLGRRIAEFWGSVDSADDTDLATSGTTIIYCYWHINSTSTIGGTTNWQFNDHAMRPIGGQTATGSGWTPDASATVYAADGRVDHTYDALGNRTDYEYYSHRDRQTSQVKKINGPDPDGDGPLQGQSAEYVYDVIGRTVEQTGFSGITTETQYDVMGRVESTTLPDPDGDGPLVEPYTEYEYDRLDRQVKMTELGNDGVLNVTETKYDDAGNRVQLTNPDPGVGVRPVTTWEYDNLGRVTRYQDPINFGSNNWYTYDYDIGTTEAESADYSLTNPVGDTTTYRHDEQGRLVQTEDGEGNIVEHEYNDQGQIVKTGNAGLSVFEEFVYGKAGELLSHTDVAGQTSTTQYDDYLRPIVATYLGVATYTAYDEVGRVDTIRRAATADHGEDITRYEYDNLSRTRFVYDSFDHFTETQYDDLGRVDTTFDKNGHATRRDYDGLNRLVTTHVDVEGLEVSKKRFYDQMGNILQIQDPRDEDPGFGSSWVCVKTDFMYDNLGRLVGERNPNDGPTTPGLTTYEYDANGNRTLVVDPGQELPDGSTLRNETRFIYDEAGRLVREVNEEGGVREWGYDNAGNIDWEKDRRGYVTEYTWEFTFDGGSNYQQDKEIWKNADGTTERTIDREYNDDGQLEWVKETGADGTLLSQITYGYDAKDLVNSVDSFLGTSHTGTAINVNLDYTFDTRNRQSSVQADVNGSDAYSNIWKYNALDQIVEITQTQTAVDKRIQFDYTASGLLDRIGRFETHSGTEHEALSSKYTYDELDRLEQLKYFVGDDVESLRYFQWSYGVDYQIDTFTTNDGTDTYLYDDADQLIGIDSTTQDDQDFVYDGNGNRITVDRTDSGGTTTDDYDHEEANRLTSDGTYTYEYDDEGNLTRKYDTNTEVIYKWDRRNRLTDVEFKDAPTGGNVTKTVEYEYNINDRRISKTVKDGSGTVTDQEFYAWDNDHNTLKIGADGTVEATNLYGPSVDMIFASEDAVGEVLWAVTDNQNTVRDIANFDETIGDNGDTTIVASREYDIFGNLIAVTGSDLSASEAIPAGYTARYWDPDAELYYYRARWYDPAIGRFISEDPLGFDAGDVNVQRYVGNNTPNSIDPSGLSLVALTPQISLIVNKGSKVYNELATTEPRKKLLDTLIESRFQHLIELSTLKSMLVAADARAANKLPPLDFVEGAHACVHEDGIHRVLYFKYRGEWFKLDMFGAGTNGGKTGFGDMGPAIAGTSANVFISRIQGQPPIVDHPAVKLEENLVDPLSGGENNGRPKPNIPGSDINSLTLLYWLEANTVESVFQALHKLFLDEDVRMVGEIKLTGKGELKDFSIFAETRLSSGPSDYIDRDHDCRSFVDRAYSIFNNEHKLRTEQEHRDAVSKRHYDWFTDEGGMGYAR